MSWIRSQFDGTVLNGGLLNYHLVTLWPQEDSHTLHNRRLPPLQMTMVVIHLKFITMVGHLSQHILSELCVKLLHMCVLRLLICILPTRVLPTNVLPLNVLKLLARSDHPGGMNLQAHNNPGGQNLQAHSNKLAGGLNLQAHNNPGGQNLQAHNNKPAGGLNLQAHSVLQSGLTSNWGIRCYTGRWWHHQAPFFLGRIKLQEQNEATLM